ncbi:molecular chaperone DnaK, partial [Pseudomonas nunensis]|nr:molecular chaperone DnaK [Pseudomonas nunensis]
ALKSALEGEDIDDIKAKKEDLEKVVQDLSTKVYEQAAQAQQQAQGEDANASQDSNVEDADFKEVKDDDNQDNQK